MTMGVTPDYVYDYILEMVPGRDALLQQLEEDAEEYRVPSVGPVVGQFLYMLARTANPDRVLEIGTAIGYSAIWLARGAKDGFVWTVERDDAMVSAAKEAIDESDVAGRVDVVPGEAPGAIPPEDPFDLVFLDADKSMYVEIFDYVVPRISPGGLLIVDNALWGGDVPRDEGDIAKQIARFNERVVEHPSFESVIVPLRDGLLIARKEE